MLIPIIGPALQLLLAGLLYRFGYISNNNIFPLPLTEEDSTSWLVWNKVMKKPAI